MNTHTPTGASILPNGYDRRSTRNKRAAGPGRDPPDSTTGRHDAYDHSQNEYIETIKRSTRHVNTTTTTSSTAQHVLSSTPTLPKSPIESDEPDMPDRPIWTTKVSLLPHTSAPLAGRISQPPSSASVPTTQQPPALDRLSLHDQEAAIIEDLLFALLGFEGQYCHYSNLYRPADEKSRLDGPRFSLSPGLDPSLESLAAQVLVTATHYAAIQAYLDIHSRDDFGAVNHALCAAMRKPLKDYLILIAQLENQADESGLSLHILCLHLRTIAHTLHQLYSLIQDILRENAALNADDGDSSDDDDFEAALALVREGPAINTGSKVCKGGAVLRLITSRLQHMSGDPAARELLVTLLHEASIPYISMLNEWLHHGAVQDPHQEFMIKEQKSIRREGLGQDYTDEYWEKRYTARDEHVPPQLHAVRERVLLAGKYLSIVRDDGGVQVSEINAASRPSMPRAIDDPRLVETVNAAYAFANSSLLNLLLTTHSLPAVFRSLKHYYFLDRSDFFSSFMHLADTELRKSAKNINVHKLQSLLDIVLRQSGSVTTDDPFKESVKVEISNTTLWKWLIQIVSVRGLDADGGSLNSTPNPAATSSRDDERTLNGFGALTLDFEVGFPLSLVVSRVTLTRYQVLFRYLLSLRHLETCLTGSWKDQEKDRIWNRTSPDRRIEAWKRRAWCLRSRMLCFVQQLLYFCTSEVIEPNWAAFMTRLEAAEVAERDGSGTNKWTVDELMQNHVDFLATCLKECMLTNSKLLNVSICRPVLL